METALKALGAAIDDMGKHCEQINDAGGTAQVERIKLALAQLTAAIEADGDA